MILTESRDSLYISRGLRGFTESQSKLREAVFEKKNVLETEKFHELNGLLDKN